MLHVLFVRKPNRLILDKYIYLKRVITQKKKKKKKKKKNA